MRNYLLFTLQMDRYCRDFVNQQETKPCKFFSNPAMLQVPKCVSFP